MVTVTFFSGDTRAFKAAFAPDFAFGKEVYQKVGLFDVRLGAGTPLQAAATVDANGVARAVGIGVATITATSEGQSGTATLTVTVP